MESVMSTKTAPFPQWSADELVAAVPAKLAPLHTFEFKLPANAAQLHRPSRRVTLSYVAKTGLSLFRVAH
jgi:hypothetical protein